MQQKKLVLWDVGLCAIIGLHITLAFVLSRVVGGDQWFNLSLTSAVYMAVPLLYVTVCFVYASIRGVVTKRKKESYREFFNIRLLKGVLVFYAISLMIGAFHSIKIMMPELVPFTWDRWFADLDRAIHGRDPWLYLRAFEPFHHQINFAYASIWMALQILLTFFSCISSMRIRVRYLYSYVSTWIICGNLIPLMFMAAGPIYYERLLGDTRFATLSRRVFDLADERNLHTLLPEVLWQAYVTKDPFIGSGISAFPSLHVALSTLLFLAAMSVNRLVGLLAGAFLVFTVLASVHLGWHYAVDGYASILLVTAIWWFWGKVTKGS